MKLLARFVNHHGIKRHRNMLNLEMAKIGCVVKLNDLDKIYKYSPRGVGKEGRKEVGLAPAPGEV